MSRWNRGYRTRSKTMKPETRFEKTGSYTREKRYRTKPKAPPKIRYRRPKEYLVVSVSCDYRSYSDSVILNLLEKFKVLGGEILIYDYVDFNETECILVDDFIPDDKLDKALDLFQGHQTITYPAVKVKQWIQEERVSTLL